MIGVDLSPIQPAYLPPNLTFEVDDVEEPWTYPEKFDFIYSRMMVGSLANVPRFMEQAFKNLSPGGYLEMADISYPVRTIDNSLPEDSALSKWFVLLLQRQRVDQLTRAGPISWWRHVREWDAQQQMGSAIRSI